MGRIEDVNLVDLYQKDMTIYKITVNGKRISPNYRDGLKEVARRILDVMCNDNRQMARTKLIKSAMVTGQVMGKSHPHGNTSIYGAVENMTQWYKCYIPLVYNESNFGDFSGAGPAAERYTEIKLSDFAKEYLLKDMMEVREVVDWYDTYNSFDQEPAFLPARVPLLMINGNYGIGVGLVSQLPPHNINEVLDATIQLIDNPNSDIVLVPDQCMDCEIIDTDWKSISNLGEGNFKVRGKIEIKKYEGVYDEKKKKKIVDKKYEGLDTLVIRSLPDNVSMDSVTDKIEEMVKANMIPQIIDSLSASTEKQPNHIFVLKKGSDPNYVKDLIYKKTNLLNTVTVRLYAMVDTDLVRFSYKSYLLAWLDFRRMTKFRLYTNKLQRASTRLHEREAYIKALESSKIDDIIDRIRKRTTTDDVELVEYLIKTLNITDLQAEYIINAGLKTLSKGYLNKYKEDAIKQKEIINDCTNAIVDESRIDKEIKEELLECKAKFGFPRRSNVITLSDDSDVPAGTFKIVVTEAGYIKKLVPTDHPTAYRGDRVKFVIKVDNRENVLLCNEQGRVFKLPVNKVPLCANNNVGFDLRILLKNNTSPIVKVFYEPILKELIKKKNKHYIVVLTEGNMIKKMDIEDIITALPSGVIYTKLKDNDRVISVEIIPDMLDVIIYSKKKALRCAMKSIPHYRKNTIGVNAMDTTDLIDGLSAIYPDATDVVVVTKSGRVNRFDISGLPQLDRYRKGSRVINLSDNDEIVFISGVNKHCSVKVVTSTTTMDIPLSDIPFSSTANKGAKLIPTKGDHIVKVSLVYHENE